MDMDVTEEIHLPIPLAFPSLQFCCASCGSGPISFCLNGTGFCN